MKFNFIKRVIGIFMVCTTVLLCIPTVVSAQEYSAEEIYRIAQEIVNWKKLDNGSTVDGNLINNTYLELAGTTPGDWYQIGMSRLGMQDDYDAYLAVVEEKIEQRYATKAKLSASKSTEWHRISLSILASGGDATAIGEDSNGIPIDLIADGTYNRGKTVSLGKQGINGWIWGLIALDSRQYKIPDNSYYSRDDIILEITKRCLSDGGFALTGTVSDPDITAMAITALAPYYNRVDIKHIVDGALVFLSNAQLATGDFASWGMENSESTSQVIIALCSLGIDPLGDSRFIKNGNNLLDGLLRYRMNDGGFVHSYTYDPENPSSKPNTSNSMAGEQALLAMAALWRLKTNKTRIYDFSDAEVKKVVTFDSADKKAVDSLPEKLTTEHYTQVVKLLEKLEKSIDFSDKDIYYKKLIEAKSKIEAIKDKIDKINTAIKEEISAEKPKDASQVSAGDNIEKTVSGIISEIETLDEYDKQKIEGYEDVEKENTKVKTKRRARWIYFVGAVCFFALLCFAVVSIYIRITRKKREEEAFLNRFSDEE